MRRGAKPEWWSDEGLKALSASVVRAAPDDMNANRMRAGALRGLTAGTWRRGPLGGGAREAAGTWTGLRRCALLRQQRRSPIAEECRREAQAM